MHQVECLPLVYVGWKPTSKIVKALYNVLKHKDIIYCRLTLTESNLLQFLVC